MKNSIPTISQMGTAKQAMVASCHPQSNPAGIFILKSGGNAVDAFIATTFADYVVAPGTTSMAGSLEALLYEPRNARVINLSAGFKTPRAAEGLWKKGTDAVGKSVLIPGAIAGLSQLHAKYGHLPWKKLLDPAIELAEDGFPLSDIYTFILKSRETSLYSSEYSRSLFFRNNQLLKPEDILRQPLLVKTLKSIQQGGDSYFYRGKWASEFLHTVNSLGGKLTADDLNCYQCRWNEPLTNDYRGYKIFAPGGMSFGGIKVILALKILEHFKIKEWGHWTENIDSLELMIRIARLIENETWIFEGEKIDDPKFIAKKLSENNIVDLCNKIERHMSDAKPHSFSHHSAVIVVVDADGMVISGMHTISSYPWGDEAIFVGGVPLNSYGVSFVGIGPNQYVPDAATLELISKDKKIIWTTGFFSSSMFPADYQTLSNLLDFEMSPSRALLSPRFGTFLIDNSTWPPSWNMDKNMIDARYSPTLINELQKRGINLAATGIYVDTGMGVVVHRDPTSGLIQGMTPEQLDGIAAGF